MIWNEKKKKNATCFFPFFSFFEPIFQKNHQTLDKCDVGCGISHCFGWNLIQFYTLMSTLKGFFVIFEDLVIESCQKLGTILLNKIFEELTRFKMILSKVVLLMQFRWNSSFKKIEVIFGIRNWLWKWKIPTVWQLFITSSLKVIKKSF